MPIDPDYPIDRINFMLENSKTKILISTENFLNNIEFSETFINIKKIDFSIKNEKNYFNRAWSCRTGSLHQNISKL